MKTDLSQNPKKIFFYALIFIGVINLVAIVSLFIFINKNVIKPIYSDEKIFKDQISAKEIKVDMEKFDSIINEINYKNSSAKKVKELNNIFY